METLFEAKIKKIDDSYGILIPKDIVESVHAEEGKKVCVGIFIRNVKVIKEMFGSAKNARSFERESYDREIY